MTNKFNPKVFQGKKRIYSAVPRAPRVSRLWIWDDEAREYRTPLHGKIYYAGRYQSDLKGAKKRVYEFFETLDEARTWQEAAKEQQPSAAPAKAVMNSGPTFGEIVQEWKRRRYHHIAYSTQLLYERLLRLYFGSLLSLSIYEITPKRVDFWLDELKEASRFGHRTRRNFEHEMELLTTILNYYVSYHDDEAFQFPIKQRHRDAVVLNREVTASPKDLSEQEFLKFREELERGSHGAMLSVLATVQYYQALRISEAAGLYWEDVQLDKTVPRNSRVKVVRSVCYPHQAGQPAFIKGGFKNAKANGGIKEQPMFPETFEALASRQRPESRGLIFQLEGEIIPYKTIQCRYDRAFREAGLPYRGTHVMRHGGCRRVFNEVGEIPIAQQLLGNADLKTTLVYAKRQASALTKVAHQYWEKHPSLLATACKSDSEN